MNSPRAAGSKTRRHDRRTRCPGSTPFDSEELLLSGLDEIRRIIREREPVGPSTRLSRTRAAQPSDSRDSAFRTPHLTLNWIGS